jgi:hypothetical protein
LSTDFVKRGCFSRRGKYLWLGLLFGGLGNGLGGSTFVAGCVTGASLVFRRPLEPNLEDCPFYSLKLVIKFNYFRYNKIEIKIKIKIVWLKVALMYE